MPVILAKAKVSPTDSEVSELARLLLGAARMGEVMFRDNDPNQKLIARIGVHVAAVRKIIPVLSRVKNDE
jgi:hypothetical protein